MNALRKASSMKVRIGAWASDLTMSSSRSDTLLIVAECECSFVILVGGMLCLLLESGRIDSSNDLNVSKELAFEDLCCID